MSVSAFLFAPQNRFTLKVSLILILIYIALTAGDLITTLAALSGGNAVELNPSAARASGGIRIGFLVASNAALLLPLLAAFAYGIANAARVPEAALRHWPRHIFDSFYVSPLSDAARARAPLRLVTAAMTLIALKVVILVSNLLAVAGAANPVSLLAGAWTAAGLDGRPRYWATYAVIIVPCYIAGVGLAAATLRAGRTDIGNSRTA